MVAFKTKCPSDKITDRITEICIEYFESGVKDSDISDGMIIALCSHLAFRSAMMGSRLDIENLTDTLLKLSHQLG